MAAKILNVLSRKKSMLEEDLGESKLARVLTILDLTALGVGSTLGLGVYVLAGSVARSEAGPAVCLSFLVAAVASAVAGLCYAEFAARVPKAGSAYVYSYVSVGEFVAYIIGWNLILEYVIGTASVARGLSNYIDALTGNVMKDFFSHYMPIDINFLSSYPDFFSLVIVMLLAVLLSIGVKESTVLNNIFTALNLITVLIVLVSGSIKADVKNWQIRKEDIPPSVKHAGEGGFLPFGFGGVMAGAAKCFYGFVGFDCVATTGEEAKNPQRSIPIAIVLSLLIIFFAYFGISTVLTMMWPYYDQIRKEDIPPSVKHAGEGGFLPFGFGGVMAGAAKCFYGFVGFDCVATTGEEAKNPQRSIPIAIVLSLLMIFFAYFGISTVLTMMWPYYDQNPDAPFPYVFDQVGWPVIKWIVTVGAIFALCTSLLGAMFPLPRILYAMANDGLLFKFLSKVHPKSQTPVVATLLSGLLAGIMAAIFDLQQLIDMMSIGTLQAYTIVAICVLVLRYEQDYNYQYPQINSDKDATVPMSIFRGVAQLFNLNMNKHPNQFSENVTKIAIIVFSLLSVAFCALIIFGIHLLMQIETYSITFLAILGILLIIIMAIIARQPISSVKLSFKVPWVPLIPCLSVVINLYLMLELDANTWIRFSVWMLLGFIIYFCYGLHNSQERKSAKKHKEKKSASTNSSFKKSKVQTLNNTADENKEITRF